MPSYTTDYDTLRETIGRVESQGESVVQVIDWPDGVLLITWRPGPFAMETREAMIDVSTFAEKAGSQVVSANPPSKPAAKKRTTTAKS